MYKKQLAHHETYSKTVDSYDLETSYTAYEVFVELGHDKEGNVLKNRDGSDRYYAIDDDQVVTLTEDTSVKVIREGLYKCLYEVNGDKVEKIEKDGRRIYYSVEPERIQVLTKGTKIVYGRNGTIKTPTELGYVLVSDIDIDNPRIISIRKFQTEDHEKEAEEAIKRRTNR